MGMTFNGPDRRNTGLGRTPGIIEQQNWASIGEQRQAMEMENTELRPEDPLRRTPRFFRNFSSASQTARAFRGQVFGGRDNTGPLYSVRRGNKFLTLGCNFTEHENLITIKTEDITE